MIKRIIAIILMLCLIVSPIAFASKSITLAWDANTESDLAGYVVYWGNSSRNYTNQEYVPLSDLSDISNPEWSGSYSSGTWFWAVTAYDNDDNESGYSNEVTTTIDTTPPNTPTGCMIKF